MSARHLRVLAWVAAAAWLVSWFLPVVDDYPGWAAFLAAIEGPFRHSFPTAPEDSIPQVFSALTNIAFPIMFALVIRDRVVHPKRFLQSAIICLVLDLYWLVQVVRANELQGLLIGYYLWLAAFVIMTTVALLSVVSSRRTSKTPTAGTPP